MNTTRRSFLKTSALGTALLSTLPAFAADKATSGKPAGFLTRQPTMKLGTVTYNLAQDWDIETRAIT